MEEDIISRLSGFEDIWKRVTAPDAAQHLGLAHFAFGCESRAEVDRLTERLRADGHPGGGRDWPGAAATSFVRTDGRYSTVQSGPSSPRSRGHR